MDQPTRWSGFVAKLPVLMEAGAAMLLVVAVAFTLAGNWGEAITWFLLSGTWVLLAWSERRRRVTLDTLLATQRLIAEAHREDQ